MGRLEDEKTRVAIKKVEKEFKKVNSFSLVVLEI